MGPQAVAAVKGDKIMPVRTKEQAANAAAMGRLIDDVLLELWMMIPDDMVKVRHPELLEQVHWDLTQIRGRLRLAVTGEYDAIS